MRSRRIPLSIAPVESEVLEVRRRMPPPEFWVVVSRRDTLKSPPQMSLTKVLEPEAIVPAPWRFSTRGLAVRLFLTCWLIYSLHVATNTVREIYLALAIGDHLSF